jgi:hypothetical protein
MGDVRARSRPVVDQERLAIDRHKERKHRRRRYAAIVSIGPSTWPARPTEQVSLTQ